MPFKSSTGKLLIFTYMLSLYTVILKKKVQTSGGALKI